MERIFERLPALAEAGIHTVINGPITYTIDGAPLIGPIPGIENAYCAIGLRAGIGESGGHGKVLAQIMVHGECEWDAWFLDPRRFSQYANTEHTCLKAIEDYQNEFHYHLPHEHRPAARLARTTPLYPVLDGLNAAWGVVNGWERALFLQARPGFVDEHSYRFTPTFDVVAREIQHLQQNVSLMEVSGFNRYEISGEGVEDFLDRMICGRLPREIGKLSLCYLLTEKGNILSEATLVKLGENRYWWGSAAAAEWHDRDWLNRHKPDIGNHHRNGRQPHDPGRRRPAIARFVAIAVATLRLVRRGISVAARTIDVHRPRRGNGDDGQLLRRAGLRTARAQRAALPGLEDTDRYAGEQFELGYFGLYATESMRLEKGYLHWKADLIVEHNPFEARLEHFVKLDKPDFIGKQALLEQIERGPRKLLVSMTSTAKRPGARRRSGVRRRMARWARSRRPATVTASARTSPTPTSNRPSANDRHRAQRRHSRLNAMARGRRFDTVRSGKPEIPRS